MIYKKVKREMLISKGKKMKLTYIFISLIFICGLFTNCDYSRGIMYYETGDYEKAIEAFNEAIRQDPDDVDSYAWRGRAYSKLGDYDRAISSINQGLSILPNHSVSKDFLREVKQQQQGSTSNTNTQQNQRTETPRQSLGNLKNTAWYFNKTYNAMGAPVSIGGGEWIPTTNLVFEEQLLEFENGNYYLQKRFVSGGSDRYEVEEGTFSVSGNSVILVSSSGQTTSGSIIGNSISIGYDNFYKN